ncbi:origin recognition complex subunit 4 [Sporothrix epigloea]|uniref:Origin recognition complex subunit 4 n=1 Tax=Sporothrix epigloea TaxID=1892477 RepID=A0ABP0DKQ7_9PEZI
MSGRAGRKRARSIGADDNGFTDENMPIGGGDTGMTANTTKRQKLASAGSTTTSRNQTRYGGGDDAALFPGPDITRTPKTARTVHAMASAITSALSYGDRLLTRPFTSLLNERNARISSRSDLDKIYDAPGDDEIEGMNRAVFGKEATSASPTVTESDGEEQTLVGAALPTLDTPSKRQPASVVRSAVEKATPVGDQKQKRHGLTESTVSGKAGPLDSGLKGSLTRSTRVRSTPKRYLSEDADVSTRNSAKRAARPQVSSKAMNGDVPDAAAVEVPHGSTASTADKEVAATNPARKHPRSAVSKNFDAAEMPTEPSLPTKKRAGSKADALAVDESAAAATSTKRPRGRPTKTTKSQPSKSVRGKIVNGKVQKETRSPTTDLQQASATRTTMLEIADDDSDDDISDGEVCAICSKPDSEPPNEIVFCETCDLAVHQQCYNIPHIPEGDWFCKNCIRQALKPQTQAFAEGTMESHEGSQVDHAEEAEDKVEAAASKLASGGAARDLAPDIANFEHHLAEMKRILLGRCTGRHRVRPRGQDEAYDKVQQMLKQTVVAGEGNSMMVIGARGTGKTTMVESILKDLAAEHGEAFHVVRLNGFIHTDDKLALREIWRQLGKEMSVEDDVVNKTNNYADTLASLLALLSHPSEIQAANVGIGGVVEKDNDGGVAVPAVTSTSVVFVIDEFDLFATHARQTLLYNLFDIAQARKAPIAVLGLTTKIDVVESLEKRVKSRFSHRYVYLSLVRSVPAFWDICRLGLVVDDDEDGGDDLVAKDITMDMDTDMTAGDINGHAEFRQWWKHMIDTAKDDAHFQDQLAFHYYSSKSVPAFWTTCILPLAAVSSTAPRLRLPPVDESALGGNLGTALDEAGVRRGVGRPPRLAGESTVATKKCLHDVDTLPLVAPGSKLYLLAALSELELSLLISAARLDIVLSTDTVNFAMAYDEYVSLMSRQRVQASLAGSGLGAGGTGATQHLSGGRGVGRPPGGSTTVVGGGARVWGRGVASRAWERLAALGLLIPAGLGAGSRGRGGGGGGSNSTVTSGLEGRSMWRTEVALEEIATAPGVRLGAVLGRWCKEI